MSQQLQALQQQFEHALEYIDANLYQPIDVSLLARMAGIPEAHFCLLFNALFHTPLEDYVSLLRLLDSAQQLAFEPNVALKDIAHKAGFTSLNEFEQHFVEHIGQSAASFRQKPNWGLLFAKQQPLKTLAQEKAAALPQGAVIDVQTLAAIDMVSIAHEAPAKYLVQTTQALSAWRQQYNVVPPESRTFNFVTETDKHGEQLLKTVVGATIETKRLAELTGIISQSEYFYISQLPQGQYAVATLHGDEQALEQLIAHLYGLWLPNSPYKLANTPLAVEKLDIDATSNQPAFKVYLPLEVDDVENT